MEEVEDAVDKEVCTQFPPATAGARKPISLSTVMSEKFVRHSNQVFLRALHCNGVV